MFTLALDASLWTSSVTLIEDSVEKLRRESAQGSAGEALAEIIADVLAEAGIAPASLGLIAVTVGPGSYTGVRGALAVARGLGLASGCPVIGVTVGEAMGDAVAAESLGRPLWIFSGAKRGALLTMEVADSVRLVEPGDIPRPPTPVAVAGDAAIAASGAMAARGDDVLLTSARQPTGISIGKVALQRLRGEIPPRDLAPLYIDAYV